MKTTRSLSILSFLVLACFTLSGCTPKPHPPGYANVFGNASDQSTFSWLGMPKDQVMNFIDVPLFDSSRVLVERSDELAWIEERYYVVYPSDSRYRSWYATYVFRGDTLKGGSIEMGNWFDIGKTPYEKWQQALRCNEPELEWSACEIGYSDETLSESH